MGILFIIFVWSVFVKMVIVFVKRRDITGIFLSAILLYWLIVANFEVILELPYFAIPFWSLFGAVARYYSNKS